MYSGYISAYLLQMSTGMLSIARIIQNSENIRNLCAPLERSGDNGAWVYNMK